MSTNEESNAGHTPDQGAAEPRAKSNSILLAIALLLAIGCRIWLASDFAPGFFNYDVDDGLYIRQSAALLDGEWMGSYDHRLLTKGPGYALFLAANASMGLPRSFSESLIHGLAALLIFVSFRRIGIGRLWSALVFLLTLFHPVFFGEVVRRVIRDGFYASLTLIVLALAIGLLARATFFSRVLQAGGLGLATAWLFITRGEGVWILPSLTAVFLGHYLLERQRNARFALMGSLLIAAIPLVMVVGTLEGWTRVNDRFYGTRVRQELKEPEYNRAMGAIQQVASANWKRYEPLSLASRKKLYTVSPKFASLKNWLESPAFRLPGMLAEDQERMAIFLSWSIRTAVRESRQAETPAEAIEFYRQLADEIESAIAKGQVPAGSKRSSQYPEVRSELFRPFCTSVAENSADLFQLEFSVTRPAPQLPRLEIGGAEREQFERILGREFGSGVRDLIKKADLADRIRLIYSNTMVWFGIMAFIALVVGLFRRRQISAIVLTVLVFLLALLSRLTMVSWLEASWFGDVENYLIVAYTLIPAMLGACLSVLCPRVRGLDRFGWVVAFLVFLSLGFGAWAYWETSPSIVLLEPSVEARILGRSGTDFLIAEDCSPLEVRRGLMLQETKADSALVWMPGQSGQEQLQGKTDLEITMTFGDAPPGRPWSIIWRPRRGLNLNARVQDFYSKPKGQNTWRIPLGEGGLGHLSIHPVPGGSAIVESIAILPALTRPLNAVDQATLRAKISEDRKSLNVSVAGAEIESLYQVYFALEAQEKPQPFGNRKGLAVIDPAKVLKGPDGNSVVLIIQTDTQGAGQASMLIPQDFSSPGPGLIWLQAMTARSLTQATQVEIKE